MMIMYVKFNEYDILVYKSIKIIVGVVCLVLFGVIFYFRVLNFCKLFINDLIENGKMDLI